MNPAFIGPYVSFPFMGNINVGATGNMGYKNFIYKLEGNPLYDQTTFMSPTVSASDFLGGLHDKNRADIYPTLFIVDSFQVIKTDMGTI